MASGCCRRGPVWSVVRVADRVVSGRGGDFFRGVDLAVQSAVDSFGAVRAGQCDNTLPFDRGILAVCTDRPERLDRAGRAVCIHTGRSRRLGCPEMEPGFRVWGILRQRSRCLFSARALSFTLRGTAIGTVGGASWRVALSIRGLFEARRTAADQGRKESLRALELLPDDAVADFRVRHGRYGLRSIDSSDDLRTLCVLCRYDPPPASKSRAAALK